MPRTVTWLVALLLTRLSAPPAAVAEAQTPVIAAPGPLDNPTAAAYRAYFIGELDAMRARFFRSDARSLQQNASNIHVAAQVAACELRAWQWTQDERYARSAVARLRLIAAQEPEIREADFFTVYPLTLAWRAAVDGKLADDALSTAMETFAARRFKARDALDLNNQTLNRACGLELAAQTWPALKQAQTWHAYALTIAALLEQTEDIPENAPNYNSLDLACAWLLTDLLKRPDLATRPGLAAMYRRYRDQVSPAGFLAPYGDSGTAPRAGDPDWPMHSPWAHYVAAFERAAHVYRDPTLRWAAVHLAQAGARHMPPSDGYTGIEALLYFSFAVDWAAADRTTTQPARASGVLTRRDAETTGAPDKLILAPSREPGAPFLLSDLYGRGAHAHENQQGAVTYFEFRDTPLLTALGYNNREPAHANLVLLAPDGEPFPHTPGGFAPGVWHEASLPSSRVPRHDESAPFRRRLDALTFRIAAGPTGVVFAAADLQLTGSDKPAIRLDDLRAVTGWQGDPTPGAEGLAWHVAAGVQMFGKTGFATDFDCREYPTLRFRWKLSNNDQPVRPVILRVQSGRHMLDYHAEARQLAPTLVAATVEQRDGIQRGTLRYTGWFTPDTTLCRELALTAAGVLVVRDTLVPGAAARGLVAGPLWHMAATNAPHAQGNWFNSAGGSMELLTWFAPVAARTFGTQAANLWSKDNQQTVFARQPLQVGQPVTFVSVLVPHERGTDPAAIATRIAVEWPEPGRARINIGDPGHPIEFSQERVAP